jgi:hypothetical protein
VSIKTRFLSDERLQVEEQNNYIAFYLIELKIIKNTLYMHRNSSIYGKLRGMHPSIYQESIADTVHDTTI